MFELVHALGSSFYIQSPAKIGLVKVDENQVVLIDSGNDKDAGRKLRQILDANHWSLRGIYCTHSNADHIGGCQYLQKQTGCPIFSSGIESTFTNYPLLEPSFLYGGYPFKELTHKFLMAQPSDCQVLLPSALPDSWEVFPLPGHFFDMVGYRTQDQVVYLADCLSSPSTLEKYKISFIYDVAAYLQTLEWVKALDAALFIPSHADATDHIAPLAQYNIDTVLEIADMIRSLCVEPIHFDSLLQALCKCYHLDLNLQQYVLIGSTLRSYLSWLKDQGELHAFFEDQILFWRKA